MPILVTGAHRSGTTWVGKMLAASGQAAYISEPLNRLHRPGVMSAPVQYWYTYICEQNQSQFLSALQDTLRLRYHPWMELKSLCSRKDLLRMGRDGYGFLRGRLRKQRPLLKDPFAVFSAAWFAQRLGCQVVVTVRHPAAFASSLKRLGWTFDFQELLSQPLLMRDWLEPYRAKMEAMLETPQDVIGQASLLWCMIYETVATLRERFPSFLILPHEDLSGDPLEGFRKIYEHLDLSFTPQAQKIILSSSSSENPGESSQRTIYATRLDSQANLENWKRRLSLDEIEQVYALTENVRRIYYPDSTSADSASAVPSAEHSRSAE